MVPLRGSLSGWWSRRLTQEHRLLTLALFALAFPANAQARGPDIINSSGSIPLGSNMKKIPSGMVVQDCQRNNNHMAECSLTDGIGRSCFVPDDLVVGVSVSFDRSKNNSILGLRHGDGYETIRRLSRHHGSSFKYGRREAETFSDTDFFKARSCLSPCRMFIRFDPAKRISRIELLADTPLFQP
jgi:hypothetical protein